MKPRLKKLAFAAMALACCSSIAAADIRIKTKNTNGAISTQSNTWIKGTRLRTAQGIGMDTIDQCDLNRTVVVNDKGKRFMVQPKGGQSSPDASSQNIDPRQQLMSKPEKTRREGKHGVTTYTTTVVDTGERMQILGFSARHLKLTTVAESSPEACSPVKVKTESDGWYIDLDLSPACNQDQKEEALLVQTFGQEAKSVVTIVEKRRQ